MRCSSSLDTAINAMKADFVARQQCRHWDIANLDELTTCFHHDESDEDWVVCACDVAFHKDCVGLYNAADIANWRCPVCTAIAAEMDDDDESEDEAQQGEE